MVHSREVTPTSTSSSLFTQMDGIAESSTSGASGASIGGASSQETSQGLDDIDKFKKRMELEQVGLSTIDAHAASGDVDVVVGVADMLYRPCRRCSSV